MILIIIVVYLFEVSLRNNVTTVVIGDNKEVLM